MYCIVATMDKTTEFGHIDLSYFFYIMSSCLKCYSVCHELNTLRRMLDSCLGVGVIVVDALGLAVYLSRT